MTCADTPVCEGAQHCALGDDQFKNYVAAAFGKSTAGAENEAQVTIGQGKCIVPIGGVAPASGFYYQYGLGLEF